MTPVNKIDISENTLRNRRSVLKILLLNRSTNKNIIWATDSYTKLGDSYLPDKPIKRDQITGKNGKRIQPRAAKSREEQIIRTKDKAEVFTPLNIVDQMNKAIDWESKNFPATEDTWVDYIKELKLEITCGEAPFIAGRYNPTANTGVVIKPKNRVGFLDRKLQIVNEFSKDKDEWFRYAEIALKSSYGYEWQGDNLLIARENILQTMDDFYKDFCSKKLKLKSKQALTNKELENFARIISWNIWQMDGLKYIVPLSGQTTESVINKNQLPLSLISDDNFSAKNHTHKDDAIYAKIKDWSKGKNGKTIRFIDIVDNKERGV